MGSALRSRSLRGHALVRLRRAPRTQMSDLPEPVVYQLKVVLQGISPMIWRRLLVKSNRG